MRGGQRAQDIGAGQPVMFGHPNQIGCGGASARIFQTDGEGLIAAELFDQTQSGNGPPTRGDQ